MGSLIELSLGSLSGSWVPGCAISGVLVGTWNVGGVVVFGGVEAVGVLFATVGTGEGSVARGALAITGWYKRRNFLLPRVTLPDPSTLTTYWSN